MIYNEDVKERFLSNYKENSQHVLKRVFQYSATTEELLGKDLYDFTTEEIEAVLKNLSPHNIEVAKALASYISSYTSWAIKEGLRASNIPFSLQGVEDEYFEQFVDKSKKIHLNEHEFYQLVSSLTNYQDQALLILFFNGIMGENFSEISNIKISDVDYEKGEIFIVSRNKSVKLFNENDAEIIRKAAEQTIYYTSDGREREIIKSNYVLKNTMSRRASSARPISRGIIYARLNSIKDNLNLEYLTPKSILQSGMIKMAVDLWEKNGKLGKEEFNQIGDRFNLSKIYYAGYEYYNRHAMKVYINEKIIKKLYGIDVYIP